MLEPLRGWTKAEKHAIAASYLGWTLDAFDFFLLVFVITEIAREFAVDVKSVTIALFVTLAARPVGAFLFGRLADRFGRRPILMLDVILYAVFAFASAFSPNLTVLLVLRALFGIAMGGEWGVGASLTMETVRPESRGVVSGILQTGYASGYLIASICYGLLFSLIGWRGLFMLGLLPALLVLYIRRNVAESPGWHAEKRSGGRITAVLSGHWQLAIYAVFLMAALNFLSHGTQDLYPTFLKVDHGFNPHLVSAIVAIANIGAILGGITFGALSQRFGRRRTLVVVALLCLPALPLWIASENVAALALGAFAMQFVVQGCWGLIPAHLNELSPAEARGTFPGTVYQLGNLVASYAGPLQAALAVQYGTYGLALALVAGVAALSVAFLASIGREAKEIDMRFAVPAQFSAE
ncbi:MAG TPA: MFS transporter [Rhizomicrobium sp.]|jgi:SHS family lactate transporter-like MFS transporter|nr:MFS transporter [Rhizomicrobium sp.]